MTAQRYDEVRGAWHPDRTLPNELEPEHAAIGFMLQDLYDRIAREPLPPDLAILLERLAIVRIVGNRG